MRDITIFIIAGGDSSRLWPLEEKHFIKFLGRPLVYYSIRQLQKFGFKNLVIVVNEKNNDDFERLKKEFNDLSITLVKQNYPRGMAGAVLSASKLITRRELLIVGPSDVYEDILLSDFDRLLKNKPAAVITGTKSQGYFPGGYLKIEDGVVTGIVEKPNPSNLPSSIVTFVFDYFRSGDLLINAITKIKSKNDDVFEKAIEYMIQNGVIFKFLPYKGFWGYFKYPWNALSLTSYFLARLKEKKIKKTNISKSAVIIGDVLIEDGVTILENAKIVGPTFIGRGTIIGNNAVVRESMIGEYSVIGYSSEITRSYIGDNCWFHKNFIGDSVIGRNVSMGAGAVIANFRLDEQPVKSVVSGKAFNTGKLKLGAIIGENVRVGVNATIMPGVKIGKNSFLGASVCLDKDLESGKYCYLGERKYVVVDNKVIISDSFRRKESLKLKSLT